MMLPAKYGSGAKTRRYMSGRMTTPNAAAAPYGLPLPLPFPVGRRTLVFSMMRRETRKQKQRTFVLGDQAAHETDEGAGEAGDVAGGIESE
jgi:hypothetical protein